MVRNGPPRLCEPPTKPCAILSLKRPASQVTTHLPQSAKWSRPAIQYRVRMEHHLRFRSNPFTTPNLTALRTWPATFIPLQPLLRKTCPRPMCPQRGRQRDLTFLGEWTTQPAPITRADRGPTRGPPRRALAQRSAANAACDAQHHGGNLLGQHHHSTTRCFANRRARHHFPRTPTRHNR